MGKMLEGVRVVDFTGFTAGPSCTKFLREWGAEDVVLESTIGSTVRTSAPESCDFCGGYGKKYLALDLKTPEGKEAAYRLIKTADVFVHNYRPKAVEKLGLDYETLKKINPGLIWAQLTGYGEKGPSKDAPGYDTVCFWARSGLSGDIAEKGTVLIPPIGFGDAAAGQGLAGAICAALYHKAKTGEGAKITTSIFAEALYLQHHALIASQCGTVHLPQTRTAPWRATLNSYKCKDGKWLTLMCGGAPATHAKEFPKMMIALDRPDLAEDPRFKPYEGTMGENAPGLVKILDGIFAQFDRDEAIRRLREVDVAVEKIQSALDVKDDPQVQANEYMVKGTIGTGQEVYIPTTPVRFDDNPPEPFEGLKPMGVHTMALLKELGYSETEVKEMAAKGITVLAEQQDD